MAGVGRLNNGLMARGAIELVKAVLLAGVVSRVMAVVRNLVVVCVSNRVTVVVMSAAVKRSILA